MSSTRTPTRPKSRVLPATPDHHLIPPSRLAHTLAAASELVAPLAQLQDPTPILPSDLLAVPMVLDLIPTAPSLQADFLTAQATAISLTEFKLSATSKVSI
ncbi:hypothetical protein L9F63_006611 [Diploptera punctata]|uniref:Uncharacterized protein n=1 Tax=Diploptera punctata TaxID=6984 RepID=A0AAD8E517_DIPPU|nr:hypothetical protein L9F63_006611 [Diploptera punctata]